MEEGVIGLADFFEKADPESIDKLLANITKCEHLIDKGMNIFEKLDKMGILPAAIRAIGVKSGVPDIDKPLKDPLALSAASPSHYQFYKFVNKIPNDKVDEMFDGLKRAIAQAQAQPQAQAETVPVNEVENVEKEE